MVNLPYDRRDADSILEYLENKATELSGGRWTDFSNGDVGTLLLKLIAYVADMNNFQIDKGLAELYIDTLTERESALSLVKILGYEPRSYKSAHTLIDLSITPGSSIQDGTMIPKYTQFTNSSATSTFYNIVEGSWYDNKCSLNVYQGTYTKEVRLDSDINDTAKLYLQSDKIDPETVTVTVYGTTLNQVENVLVDVSNTLAYSVHTDSKDRMYIQLPSYYGDFISSGTTISIEYLISSGVNGNIGSNILTQVISSSNLGISPGAIVVSQPLASTGAEDPETIEEIQEGAPLYASTMNTMVTLEDIQLAKYKVNGISDIIALDYNSPESGLVQPADAYKVNIYVLPKDSDYIIDPNQQLTPVGEELKKYIDERRLTSIMITYMNVEIITPEIEINAYIDRYNLHTSSLESTIKDIILKNYNRDVFKIGQGIYSSKLGKQILDEVSYCNYIEVKQPNDSYIPNKTQFLEVLPENIIINVIEE